MIEVAEILTNQQAYVDSSGEVKPSADIEEFLDNDTAEPTQIIVEELPEMNPEVTSTETERLLNGPSQLALKNALDIHHQFSWEYNQLMKEIKEKRAVYKKSGYTDERIEQLLGRDFGNRINHIVLHKAAPGDTAEKIFSLMGGHSLVMEEGLSKDDAVIVPFRLPLTPQQRWAQRTAQQNADNNERDAHSRAFKD